MRRKIVVLSCIFGMLYSTATIFPQSFTPQNGAAYNVNLNKWLQGGKDVTAATKKRLAFSILFYPGYTDFTFGTAMGSGTARIYGDGTMELIRKVLFLKPSIYAAGTGTVERSGRSVKLIFQIEDGEINEIEITEIEV